LLELWFITFGKLKEQNKSVHFKPTGAQSPMLSKTDKRTATV
jgi:hypothetical protein